MEVRVHVRDPLQKGGDVLAGLQRLQRRIQPRQILVADIGVDRTVADRVEGDRVAAALAVGDDMVPFDPGPERTAA